MEEREYQIAFEMETTHWWFVARRFLIFDDFRYIPKKNPRILDAGCGTGGNIEYLNRRGSTIGVDNSFSALNYCRRRGLSQLVRANVCSLPFKEGVFDAVISLDVLYHKMVTDDRKALAQMYRVLKKGGIMLVTSPAFKFLSSRHDKAMHTARRYTRRSLENKIMNVGFRILKSSYIFMIPFPVVVLIRLVQKMGFSSNRVVSDFRKYPRLINRLLIWIMRLEHLLLKFLNLPFGISVLCIARKGQDN